jgi:flagellar hook-associated protein 2
MAGSLALSGLASGVDTSGIIEKLMSIESQGRTRLTTKQSQIQTRETQIKDVQAKLTALKTAAAALTEATTWSSAQTVESSDASRVSATLLGATAGAGGSSVNVTKLAASAQHGYDYSPAAGATIALMRGTPATQVGASVTIDPGTSIKDAATKINAANLDVSATVVTEGGVDTLVFAAKSTGDASAFSISGLSASANTRWERTGNDAEYTVDADPTVRKSATNTLENAIPGVKLTFKSTTPSPVTITVGSPGLDTDAVQKKVQAYVDAYNGLISTVNAKVTEKSIPKDKAVLQSDLTKGSLYGDTGLTGMISRLRSMSVTNDPLNAWDSLGDLGITTGKAAGTSTADSKLGKLTIDTTQLSNLLASDPAKVKTLLGNVSKQISDYVDGQNDVLSGRVTSSESELKGLSDQLRRTDDQLKLKQSRLEAQFAAMETALSQSQSQQSWLSGQLAALA